LGNSIVCKFFQPSNILLILVAFEISILEILILINEEHQKSILSNIVTFFILKLIKSIEVKELHWANISLTDFISILLNRGENEISINSEHNANIFSQVIFIYNKI